ncbi:hypothetical protein GGQ73_003192 [Rhizobium skierniewicense]|uniref:Phage head morphogenesis domain-containing protein n=1 Tax=Rhizobium skierniewicense TaxID=984260 RepID=A0A7W6G482_9HYPH|nr:phage minor head protein [Rhizobium skierniewicense]MBB3947226.1 hypothetical protein [Rhizobium skierniewicense]
MTGSPLTRFKGLFAAIPAGSSQNASTAFNSASIFGSSIITLMASAIDALSLPFDEAIDFLRQKTAVPTKSYRDVWDAAHSKMFMVAGANSQALVDDFQNAIVKAAEQGLTLEDFRADFDDIVKRHGWQYKGARGWRSRLIFETNLASAYAAGRYAQMSEPDTLEAFPFWQYNHSGALHPRLNHKAWDGMVFAADDPFWNTNYPPNGYKCGCFVTPVSRPGLKRLGKSKPDEAPNLDQLGTDQPLGVDPSFAYNPGKAWLEQTAPGATPVSANEVQVNSFILSAARGKWPDGSWTPAGVTSEAIAADLGVKAGTEFRLLAETVRDLDISRTDAASYATVPRRLARAGKVTSRGNGIYTVSGEHQGRDWSLDVALAEDDDRQRLYVRTLREGGL